MRLNGKAAEAFAAKPDSKIWAALIFGEDDGQVSDVARTLTTHWTKGAVDPEIITLDEDQLRREPAILWDALEAISLLGNDRIIKVRTSGNKLASELQQVMAEGDKRPGRFAAKLIMLAGALQKRSKLRASAEDAKQTAALHLYADDVSDIEQIVRSALKAASVKIDDDAISMFCAALPGHRGLARAEIEKLELFAHGLGRTVNAVDIRRLSPGNADHGVSETLIAIFSGNAEAAHDSLDRLIIAGTSGISILRGLEREVMRMLSAHAIIARGEASPGRKLRPPVYDQDWPGFKARLNQWSVKHLQRLLERLYEAEQAAKTSAAQTDAIVRMLINDLAKVSAR